MIDGFTDQGAYHFRDICAVTLGRKYVNTFYQYFFEGQDVKAACLSGNTPLKCPYPLGRGVGTAFVFFAYGDTDIAFGMDSYDFLQINCVILLPAALCSIPS